jgi:hypothetical protein
MPFALGLQPIQHFVINAEGDLRLEGPVVLADGGAGPVAGGAVVGRPPIGPARGPVCGMPFWSLR